MQLLWESVKPEENRYRFYSLSIGPDLWGEPCLVSRWGRLWGSPSREAFNWPEAEGEVQVIVQATHRNRLRHGYRLVKGNLQGIK